jgi:hypothetical protein
MLGRLVSFTVGEHADYARIEEAFGTKSAIFVLFYAKPSPANGALLHRLMKRLDKFDSGFRFVVVARSLEFVPASLLSAPCYEFVDEFAARRCVAGLENLMGPVLRAPRARKLAHSVFVASARLNFVGRAAGFSIPLAAVRSACYALRDAVEAEMLQPQAIDAMIIDALTEAIGIPEVLPEFEYIATDALKSIRGPPEFEIDVPFGDWLLSRHFFKPLRALVERSEKIGDLTRALPVRLELAQITGPFRAFVVGEARSFNATLGLAMRGTTTSVTPRRWREASGWVGGVDITRFVNRLRDVTTMLRNWPPLRIDVRAVSNVRALFSSIELCVGPGERLAFEVGPDDARPPKRGFAIVGCWLKRVSVDGSRFSFAGPLLSPLPTLICKIVSATSQSHGRLPIWKALPTRTTSLACDLGVGEGVSGNFVRMADFDWLIDEDQATCTGAGVICHISRHFG